MSPMRVLVAEDSAPFWEFIRSTLAERPDVQIIGEVADGLEAVQKAELLEPDLVLLDIGLPTLNGIEAARQIRKLAPVVRRNIVSHPRRFRRHGSFLASCSSWLRLYF